MKLSLLFNIVSVHWLEMREALQLQLHSGDWQLRWLANPAWNDYICSTHVPRKAAILFLLYVLMWGYTLHEQIDMCTCAKSSHLPNLRHLNAKKKHHLRASKRSEWHLGGKMGSLWEPLWHRDLMNNWHLFLWSSHSRTKSSATREVGQKGKNWFA